MGTLYKNYRKADIGTSALPGYAPNAFILPTSWVDSFGEAVANPTMAGNKYIIEESHVPLTDKGAIAVYCVPKTTEANGELVGESMAKRYQWKPKIIIPGDSPALQELVSGLINETFLLFVKDSTCGANEYVQFGCDCDPCEVESSTFASGTTGEGRKQHEMTMLTYCRFFYRGVIAELEDGDGEPA